MNKNKNLIGFAIQEVIRLSNKELAMRLDQHADWYIEFMENTEDIETSVEIQAEIHMLKEAVHRLKQIDNTNK